MSVLGLTIPPLDNTLGAVFLGGSIAAILFGITCVQTYWYYLRCDELEDSWTLKSTVAILWLLDALSLAFGIHTLYFYMVTEYANPFALLQPTWSIVTCILLTSMIFAIVSSVYSWRIWVVSGRKWFLVIPPFITCLISFALSVAIVALCFKLKFFTKILHFSWLLYWSFSTNVATDVSIAFILCYYLHQSRTGIRNTDSLLNRLMLYCVSTSLISGATALGALVTFATMPTNFIYIGIYLVRPKVCCNALLSTLNAREDRNKKSQVEQLSTSFRVNCVVGSTGTAASTSGQDSSFIEEKQSRLTGSAQRLSGHYIASESTGDSLKDVIDVSVA